MATFSVTNTFVVNTRARSAEVNANFTDVLNILAAHHHDPNIYTGAKPITNSGIAANAQINDTQLKSQITRSGLINQTSLGIIDAPGIISRTALSDTISPTVSLFAGSGTWTKPTGLVYVIVEMVGGGGPGLGFTSNSTASYNGGGGGGYAKKVLRASQLAGTVSVTIGAGGIGNTSTGTPGGTTSFGAHFSATGGSGDGTAGAGSGGDMNLSGQTGDAGFIDNIGASATGISGKGGNSFFGYGADSVRGTANSAGASASGYGGGGSGGLNSSGTTTDQNGGNGAPGLLIVYEYY